MSQQALASFLDKHPGKNYTTLELHIRFSKSMNRTSVCRCLRMLVKRDEYECKIRTDVGRGGQIYYYGRKQ